MMSGNDDWPKMPAWWWVVAAAGVAFWATVIYVAVHFISKWW